MSPFRILLLGCLLSLVLVAQPARAEGMNIVRDEEIEQSLKIMSKPVFDQAGLSADAVRFVLVENSALNAFVAGGQNIFLHSGLILETQNPAELVGVIAHETGHIADGHLLRGQAQVSNSAMQAMLTGFLGLAVAMGTRSADAGMAIGNMGATIATRNFLRHTRTQEGSADQAGVRFLRDARLPVTGFLSFMKKLESQELLPESQQSEYVQTHPLTQDRVDFLQHVVNDTPQGSTPAAWNEMHNRMRAKLWGYIFPDYALQGKDMSVAGQYSRAIAWFRKGQIDKAMDVLAPLLKEEPDNPYFYELKGQILFSSGAVDAAVAAYARAVELAPFSGLIRISYAQSLLESKEKQAERRAEAIRQLNMAISREKYMSEPHYLLAVAYGKDGQEGLSRLHLAERALLQNNIEFAKREASLAKSNLKKGTPAYLRAEDILDISDENSKKGGKRG